MNGLVVRDVRRADSALVASLGRLGVSTVHEAQGRTEVMQPYMWPLWRGARIVARGDAKTVATAGEEREEKETASRGRLKSGGLGLDVDGMREALEEEGLKYVGGPLD